MAGPIWRTKVRGLLEAGTERREWLGSSSLDIKDAQSGPARLDELRPMQREWSGQTGATRVATRGLEWGWNPHDASLPLPLPSEAILALW